MRVSINLEDDAYQVAKDFAAHHNVTLGEALSELIVRSQVPVAIANEGRFLSYQGKQVLTPELARELDPEW